MIAVIDEGGFLYEINVSGTADSSPSLVRGGVFYFAKDFVISSIVVFKKILHYVQNDRWRVIVSTKPRA